MYPRLYECVCVCSPHTSHTSHKTHTTHLTSLTHHENLLTSMISNANSYSCIDANNIIASNCYGLRDGMYLKLIMYIIRDADTDADTDTDTDTD